MFFFLQKEWSICRVFEKSSCGKKMHIEDLVRFNSIGKELLPPLMDSSPYNSETKATIKDSSHVTCFNEPNLIDDYQSTQDNDNNIVGSFDTPMLTSSYSSNPSYDNISPLSWTPSLSHQSTQVGNSQSFDVDISSIMYSNEMFQRSYVNEEYSSALVGHFDTGCIWNF